MMLSHIKYSDYNFPPLLLVPPYNPSHLNPPLSVCHEKTNRFLSDKIKAKTNIRVGQNNQKEEPKKRHKNAQRPTCLYTQKYHGKTKLKAIIHTQITCRIEREKR